MSDIYLYTGRRRSGDNSEAELQDFFFYFVFILVQIFECCF